MRGARTDDSEVYNDGFGTKVKRDVRFDIVSRLERIVVLYCTYSTYVPYSLSPYRVLNSDTASALTSLSRHIVISPLSS